MGNISVVCLVDSAETSEYSILDDAIWCALKHFGVPFEVFDLSKTDISHETLSSHSLIIIAQDGLGAALSIEEAENIADSVKEGTGLVSFDGRVDEYRDPLKKMLGISTSPEPTHQESLMVSAVRTVNNTHFITYTREIGSVLKFKKPVLMGNVTEVRKNSQILLVGAFNGRPVVFTTTFGEGKAVIFTLSLKVWLPEYLGHAQGLDDVFWKSLVWAAKKPFVMFAIPPFVTIRIDDCSGANDHFGYIDILNKHNYIPNIGLFTENITEADAKVIKEKYDAGLAEFSPHALTTHKLIYFDPKIPEHDGGKERTESELKKMFKRLDEQFTSWGIKPSKVLNYHWAELGKNALPFLKKRGITFLHGPAWNFGEAWNAPHEDLKIKPYGMIGKMGGYFYGKHPQDPDFYIFMAFPSGYPLTDFLGGGIVKSNSIEEAARIASHTIKLGLDSLFFGCPLTHEYLISCLTSEEFDRLLTIVDKLTERYHKIFKGLDYIGEYLKNRDQCSISEVKYDKATNKIECIIKGKSTMPLYLYVYREKGSSVEYRLQEIPSFEGLLKITFQVEGIFIPFDSTMSKELH